MARSLEQYIVDCTTRCCKRKIGEYGRSFAICRNAGCKTKPVEECSVILA